MSKISPYPGLNCLMVCVEHAKTAGPVGHRHGNPAVGWVVYLGQRRVTSTVFKSLREAKRYVEHHYPISGWLHPRSVSPYHQHYAIPR